MPRDIVEFEPNVPVQVALAFPTGKIIDTRMGQRVMFSLVDGRVMFLDLAVAEQINQLRPKPHEPFYVRKEQASRRGSPVTWHVFQPKYGEQQNGTFVVPKEPEASVSAPAPATAPISAPATNNGNGSKPAASLPIAPAIAAGWGNFLLSHTTALIDIYAAALKYAGEKHGNAVKPDGVRALLTTAFISQSKGGVHG